MFERFTERARQVVVHAQAEARDLNHNYIGTEHLLLGLLADPGWASAKALASFGVMPDGAREQVIEMVGRGETSPSGQIPFTPRAKRTLEMALREALAWGHHNIGTGHVLLGLSQEGEGLGAKIISDYGATHEAIGDRLREMDEFEQELAGGPNMPAPRAVRTGTMSEEGIVFAVRPDRELRRLLMRAGGRALQDERTEFGLAELLAVAWGIPELRQLLIDQVREDDEPAA